MPKEGQQRTPTVVYVREIPREVANRLKAAAALEGKSLQEYLIQLLSNHVADLEERGLLPKRKR